VPTRGIPSWCCVPGVKCWNTVHLDWTSAGKCEVEGCEPVTFQLMKGSVAILHERGKLNWFHSWIHLYIFCHYQSRTNLVNFNFLIKRKLIGQIILWTSTWPLQTAVKLIQNPTIHTRMAHVSVLGLEAWEQGYSYTITVTETASPLPLTHVYLSSKP